MAHRWRVGQGLGKGAVLHVLVVVATLGIIGSVGAALPADACAAAVFSGVTPVGGTTVPGSPSSVRVFVDDASMILESSTITINDVVMPTSVDWVGHIEDPDCEAYWVVDDWTAATISYAPNPPLPEGSYTVTATVNTASSGTSTYTWSFTIEYPEGSAATFWSMVPAPNTTITDPVQFQVRVGSVNPIPYSGITTYLDGVVVGHYATAGGGNQMFVYTPAIAPRDGVRTFKVGVTDSLGIYTEYSWNITAQIKPTLSAPTPYGANSMPSQRPGIGLNIADNTPGQLNVRLVFDGVQVFNGLADQGAFRWTPPSDLPLDTQHTVLAEVTDAAGNVSTMAWGFSDIELIDNVSPGPNAILSGSPGSVSLRIDAGTRIMESSAISIDGVPVATSVDWLGHVEDPDCEAYWVVDDWTIATVSAQSGVLLEGTHTVSVTVDTLSTGTITYAWTFDIVYAPGSNATFSNIAPAGGSTIAAVAPLRVTLTSVNPMRNTGINVYLDGTRVNATANTWNPVTVINMTAAAGSFPMVDGPHTVRVTVLDTVGVFTEYSWAFNAQIAPGVSTPNPPNATAVTVARPPIGLAVSDNTPGQVRVRLRLDGASVYDAWVNQGVFTWTPTTDFANNSNHTVIADVWDAAGNLRTLTWSFSAVARPPMTTASDCSTCHAPATHPFSNCEGCHQDDPLYDPHGANRYGPVGRCYDCHGYGYGHSVGTVANCAYCHANTDWVQIPRHNEPVVNAKHETATTGCAAVGCHSTSLIEEHGKYPSTSEFKYQCFLCHVNASAAVNAAVAANDTNCIACHGTADPHHEPADVSALAGGGPQCSACHSNGLTWEHAKPTSSSAAAGCDACHAPGGARDSVVGAWDRSCDTAGCHDAATVTRPVHTNYCLACHDVSQSDFSVAKTSFPPVAPVDYQTACEACHLPGFAGSHPYHQIGANCAAACHQGWGASKLTATPRWTDPVSGAAFSSAESVETSPAILHAIHSQARWPANVDTEFSACSSCHAVAACNACHAGAIPTQHKLHSSAGSANYPAVDPWSGTIGRGVTDGDETQHSAVATELQCGAVGCHDLDAQGSAHADVIEQSGAGITVVGTWRSRWSTLYSGGTINFSNSPTALLTAAFSGARVEIISDLDPYRGRAEVLIDGGVVGTFDSYAPVTSAQAIVFTADVTPGAHTVSVRPLGESNPSSRGNYVVVDGFSVYAELPTDAVPPCTGCHADRASDHW